MQNFMRQNFQLYNHYYPNQENQYLNHENKDNFQNYQDRKTRALSPNLDKKINNQEYSYLNKKEIPLKNSNKQNLPPTKNQESYQAYPYKQNISSQSNTLNYFSPIPKQMPENINIHNYNFTANKYQDITKYNVKKNKKTLILDLDETLVHSGFHPFNRKSDFTLNIKVDGKNHTIYVLKRPYVEEFLSEIAPYYDIIIFTASISEYASPLLDLLDKKKLTTGRLYRQHCLFNHGLYLKDIKIIQKDLKDVIIIDNNPVSYVMNQDNGLPILTWYDDLNDKELINFIPLLKYLSTQDDVREVIKKIVDKQSNKIKFETVDELIKQKINENNNYKDMIYQTNNNYNKVLFSNDNFKNKVELNSNSNYNQNYINNNNYNEKKYEIKINNNFDINKDYNINKFITDEEKKIKNYFNDDNNFYKYNNYNNSIHDSLSNMTYNEIQNEGTIDDDKENKNDYANFDNNIKYNNININKSSQNYVIQKAINYDNHKHYEERNKQNNFKQKDFLNNENKINKKMEIGTQSDSNYEYQINNLNNLKLNDNIKENQFKRNYTSNTYNPNISRSNYKYNFNEQKYINNAQFIPRETKNYYNYEQRYLINNDKKGDKQYFNGNEPNYMNENNKYLEKITFDKKGKDDNLRDNYLKLYQQKLLKLRMNENNYQNNNLSNNNNANVNNIHIYQNKNNKSQYNPNKNYQNNNNITRNHSINSLNYRRNNINLINFNNKNNQINNIDNFYNQRFLNVKNQDDLVKKEEKIDKKEEKNFKENNEQKKDNNLRFYRTQINFMKNSKNKDNNIFKINNSNLKREDFRFNNNFRRNNEEKEQRIIQPKINNYFNDNELDRSFSGKKDFIKNNATNIDLDRKPVERKKYDFSPYYMNKKESNEVDIRNLNNNNLMNYMNERNETDLNKEKMNENFYKNNFENKNNNIGNIDKRFVYSGGNNNYINNYYQNLNRYKNENQNNDYNNKSKFKYPHNLSRTEERKFYRSSSSKPYNANNKYLNNNENSRIPRNYNNININNYNFYNSFIGNNTNNKKENVDEKRNFNDKYRIQYYINKDDEQENPLNRSSSFFHPKPNYYSLLNHNMNSYTQTALRKNNQTKSKFLNNFGNYGPF